MLTMSLLVLFSITNIMFSSKNVVITLILTRKVRSGSNLMIIVSSKTLIEKTSTLVYSEK